jgi:hypothetical protein
MYFEIKNKKIFLQDENVIYIESMLTLSININFRITQRNYYFIYFRELKSLLNDKINISYNNEFFKE